MQKSKIPYVLSIVALQLAFFGYLALADLDVFILYEETTKKVIQEPIEIMKTLWKPISFFSALVALLIAWFLYFLLEIKSKNDLEKRIERLNKKHAERSEILREERASLEYRKEVFEEEKKD